MRKELKIMKALGIVRRIDDLGRVVIPKEIRRSLKIREGDALELYRDDDMVCLRKVETEKNFIKDVEKMNYDIAELLYSWDNKEELSLIAKAFDVILEQLNIIETKREEY
jgi:AbrB family transcriptional regulator (stage V sporulation protein T)